MAKSKRKPLSFSTTIRNPERIPKFLNCILPFEGKILTSEIIHEIIKNIIREKEYVPVYINKNIELNKILINSEKSFSDEQLEDIIKNSPQNHKEKGFEKGWDSRFDTWYKLIKEFGFIKYSINNPIVITQTGHMLIDAYREIPVNNKKIQLVYLNSLMKYQTNNPLRKNLNDSVPLPLLLSVIKLFRDDLEENNSGILRNEIPILLCWQNNNPHELYEYIKEIRKEYRFNQSDELIYEKCLSLLESKNRTYYKFDKICGESVDEYIRKMRMSGLLSLRGNGRFLDFNTYENDLIEYVISNYMIYKKYNDAEKYIDYMGQIDTNIIKIEDNSKHNYSIARKITLEKYAKLLSVSTVENELKLVCNKKESKHPMLKYINAPTRLEFLTSIVLKQKFNTLDVNPNYIVDDEGIPIYTASGNRSDIECYDVDVDCYFEVTLMCNRNDQVHNEIIPISRHLKEAKIKKRSESFSVLVAPIIHDDTKKSAEWIKWNDGLDILTYNINEFIDVISKKDRISELLKNI